MSMLRSDTGLGDPAQAAHCFAVPPAQPGNFVSSIRLRKTLIILETAVDRLEMTVTTWIQERFSHVSIHPQGKGRYGPWCTSRAAPGCVTTRWN